MRFDPRTGALTSLGELAGRASALCYGGGYLWATHRARPTCIARVNPRRAANAVTDARPGTGPLQIVAAGGRLFVASNTDHSVLVVRSASRRSQVGQPLEVPHNPYAIAADDARGVGHRGSARTR